MDMCTLSDINAITEYFFYVFFSSQLYLFVIFGCTGFLLL